MLSHTSRSLLWEGIKIVKPHHTASIIPLTLKPNSKIKCLCSIKVETVHEYQWRHIKELVPFGVLLKRGKSGVVTAA